VKNEGRGVMEELFYGNGARMSFRWREMKAKVGEMKAEMGKRER
jgi:hypothetical protein